LPVDFRMRWHDRPTWRAYRYLSWVICALSFPHRKEYDLFLTEGPHFPPLIMKKLGILKEGQRVAALMANETLYLLKTPYYSKTVKGCLISALVAYDALICVGKMQSLMASEHTSGSKRPPTIHCVANCVPNRRREALESVAPDLESQRIVYIANGSPGWRSHYKGLDLTMESAALAAREYDRLSLSIAGEWPSDFLREYSRVFADPNRVAHLGKVDDLARVLSGAALYLHLGRGDAFPTSVLEAMAAGLPCIVSEWTGTREAVEQVDRRLVVPADPEAAADRIRWYLSLPTSEKQRLSERSREVAATYTEVRATQAFREAISQIM
jgi:glycosyltransferase involved in cell wall biosynthesis